MALPKIKFGDLFEIVTSRGLAYFQCVKESPATECELIRILPSITSNIEEVNFNRIVEEKEIFFIQFALKYAVKKKCVKFIGNFKVPEEVVVPRYFRSIHKIKHEFISWHIVDSETLYRQSVQVLTDEQKKLSPWEIWNDTLLAERIAEGWTLDKWV